MKDSYFSDDQVLGVSQRHRTRKAKNSWDEKDRASAIEDMDNILAELHRTNVMVEILRENAETVAALLPSPPSAKQI